MPRIATGRLVIALVALLVLGGLGLFAEQRLRSQVLATPSPPPSGSPAPTMPPLIESGELAALFADPPAEPLRTSGGTATITVREAEPIQLPTGRLAAADVFFLQEPLVFALRLPAGETPVTLLVASYADDDQRVAAILLGDPAAAGDPAVTWLPAAIEGAPPDGQLHAFGVDSGTAGFTSVEGSAHIAADDGYPDRMLEALESVDFGDPVHVPLDEARALDVVAVPSGFGDGAYVTWVATTADGTARAYLTSFDILDRPGPPVS